MATTRSLFRFPNPVNEFAARSVAAGVVVGVRLPIAQAVAQEWEAHRPRCAPSGIAPTSKSKQFSTRSS